MIYLGGGMEAVYEKLTKDKNPIILIVDDIPKNLQVLSNILNTEGYSISFASNGKQALSVVDSVQPDLILLDIMMPEMDGFEVCKILKADSKNAHIPIIFLTGKADTDDIIKGLKLGAVDYVTKPFNSAELLTRVKTHLELKLSRDAIVKYSNELEQAQIELKALNASKDKFFSIVAHDLKGPFTGFLGLAQLLQEDYKKLNEKDVATIAENMYKAAKRLFSFLENLLDWSRSQMGRIDFCPGQIDISDTFTRIFNLFSATANEKKISLINNIEQYTFVWADNNMLNTICRNFVSNAIKFTPENGKITINLTQPNPDFYEISVSDTGVGIDEASQKKLFRIDVKHSTPGTANEQGTGLGLVLCKDLITRNGGEVRLESVEDEGTTFYFTLPKFKKEFVNKELEWENQ